jgi:hypothetical protein
MSMSSSCRFHNAVLVPSFNDGEGAQPYAEPRPVVKQIRFAVTGRNQPVHGKVVADAHACHELMACDDDIIVWMQPHNRLCRQAGTGRDAYRPVISVESHDVALWMEHRSARVVRHDAIDRRKQASRIALLQLN